MSHRAQQTEMEFQALRLRLRVDFDTATSDGAVLLSLADSHAPVCMPLDDFRAMVGEALRFRFVADWRGWRSPAASIVQMSPDLYAPTHFYIRDATAGELLLSNDELSLLGAMYFIVTYFSLLTVRLAQRQWHFYAPITGATQFVFNRPTLLAAFRVDANEFELLDKAGGRRFALTAYDRQLLAAYENRNANVFQLCGGRTLLVDMHDRHTHDASVMNLDREDFGFVVGCAQLYCAVEDYDRRVVPLAWSA